MGTDDKTPKVHTYSEYIEMKGWSFNFDKTQMWQRRSSSKKVKQVHLHKSLKFERLSFRYMVDQDCLYL